MLCQRVIVCTGTMKDKILLSLLALLFTALVAVTCRASEIASWWVVVFPAGREQQSLLNEKAENLLPFLKLQDNTSFQQKTDAVRLFLYEHSVHKEDEEFFSYWGDMPRLLDMVAAHAAEGAKRPHMECASRSAVMYHMLRAMNVRARIVILRPYGNVRLSHTLLEVFNPETARWEIQDPDRNHYWIFRDTEKRAGVEDLLRYPIAGTFMPCRTPQDCGYTAEDRKVEFLDKYALASILDIAAGANVLLVSKTRFGLDHPFLRINPMAHSELLPYCELFGPECHKRIIAVEEDSEGGR